MQILRNLDACVGCGACANICPKHCITMRINEEGFLYPHVDEAFCIECKNCQLVCPVLNQYVCSDIATRAFAAYVCDDETRFQSTSGGIFTLLSKWVINQRGIVYGAAYDGDFKVIHMRCDSMNQVKRLLQAKYSQSDLGNTFIEIKQLLEQERYVLFSGTPCQVYALKTFLKKDYIRLYLVDLICHGVPSPGVWSRYVSYRSERDNGGEYPLSINMRSKETGWPAYSVCFEYQGGNRYIQKNSLDPFMRAFVKDLCLRKSCYDCKFKGIDRISDFTLGDYWGIWSQMPEFNDGKGASIVLIHSEKAMEVWNVIKNECEYRELNPQVSVSENPAAEYSVEYPEQRDAFLERFLKEDFQNLVDSLCPIQEEKNSTESWMARKLRKIKKLIKNN